MLTGHHRLTAGAVPPAGPVDDDGRGEVLLPHEDEAVPGDLRRGHPEAAQPEQVHPGLQEAD